MSMWRSAGQFPISSKQKTTKMSIFRKVWRSGSFLFRGRILTSMIYFKKYPKGEGSYRRQTDINDIFVDDKRESCPCRRQNPSTKSPSWDTDLVISFQTLKTLLLLVWIISIFRHSLSLILLLSCEWTYYQSLIALKLFFIFFSWQ